MAATGALGGLGMLAGALLDARSSGLPACHAGAGGLASWMTAGMLAGCVPACLWLSPDCRSTARWSHHAGCLVGMVAGMLFGGRWLAPVLGAMVTAPAIHHIAMVLGMMLGAAVGSQAMHREAALDPPRPTPSSAAGRGHAGRASVPPRATAQLRGASEP